MSSPPADTGPEANGPGPDEEPSETKSRRPRRPFEPWRKVMLVGAVILLAQSLVNAFVEGGLPDWGRFILSFLGYGFLAAGFAIRMRAIKEARESRSEEGDPKGSGGEAD